MGAEGLCPQVMTAYVGSAKREGSLAGLLAGSDAVLDDEFGELLAVDEFDPDAALFGIMLGGLESVFGNRARGNDHSEIRALRFDPADQLLDDPAVDQRLRLPVLGLDGKPLLKGTGDPKARYQIRTFIGMSWNDRALHGPETQLNRFYQMLKLITICKAAPQQNFNILGP